MIKIFERDARVRKEDKMRIIRVIKSGFKEKILSTDDGNFSVFSR